MSQFDYLNDRADSPAPPTTITSPPGWSATVQAAMDAGDAPAGIAPKYTGGNPGPTDWQKFSAWATSHQKELAIGAAVIAAIILLTALSGRSR